MNHKYGRPVSHSAWPRFKILKCLLVSGSSSFPSGRLLISPSCIDSKFQLHFGPQVPFIAQRSKELTSLWSRQNSPSLEFIYFRSFMKLCDLFLPSSFFPSFLPSFLPFSHSPSFFLFHTLKDFYRLKWNYIPSNH